MTKEDCISRDEVLKQINCWIGSGEYKYAMSERFLIDRIKTLSPVNPQEPCDDAIDRAEAMTEIMMFAGNVKPDKENIYIKVSDAVQLLRELPSVTSKPKTGHWKPMCCLVNKRCSECNFIVREEHSECPNCGAKMESEGT